MYYVYVIANSQGKIYIGQTANLSNRLDAHNKGISSYTKKIGGPWKIIYQEDYDTRAQAKQRETYFKQGSGHRLLRDILKIRGVA